MKPAREPASSRPKSCASLKKPHKSCPFAAPCGPRRNKKDRGQTSAFPSETSRFAPLILAHRGSALPWLVDDRVALRPRRIYCNDLIAEICHREPPVPFHVCWPSFVSPCSPSSWLVDVTFSAWRLFLVCLSS